MDDEKKFCSNCKRDIPSANHEMHVIHCQRNIQLCPTCEEPVPRSQMESHKQEYHSIIVCPECRDKMESSTMDDHKGNQCSKRIVSCQFCELDLKADEIAEHENYCGSRTEDCENCGKKYMIKFRDLHLESNHRLLQPDDNKSSESDGNVEEDIDDNLFSNNFSRFEGSSFFRNREHNHFHRTAPYHRNTRRNRSPNYDIDLDEHFDNMRINNVYNPLQGNAFQFPGNQLNRQEESALIPCEFCEIPIIAEELVLHQTGCRPDLVSRQSTNSTISVASLPRVRNDDIVDVESDGDDDDIQYLGSRYDNPVLIPCEFCAQPFSAETVTHHQITCGDNHEYGHADYN